MLVWVLAAGCSTASAELPGSLYGAWTKDGGEVAQVEFSDGGRIELILHDGTECIGEYGLSAMSDTEAILSTGYIQCPGLMDGYEMGADLTVEGNTLSIRGVFGGTYARAS